MTEDISKLKELCLSSDSSKIFKLANETILKNIGQTFSLLTLGLSLDPSKKSEYYKIYFNTFEKWYHQLMNKSRFDDALKLFDAAQDIFPNSPDFNYLLAETLFRECFGNQGSKYYEEVWPLLIAVDQGVKPSFLWDVCTPDTSALLNLLTIASEKQLLTNTLKVVEVDLDVFIININSIITVLTKLLTVENSWLVDLSTSKPKIASKEIHLSFRQHLISLLKQLGISGNIDEATNNVNSSQFLSNSAMETESTAATCLSKDKAITIQFPEDINLSTIFGCLLGYPQIYWWQGESGENSLSGVPLKVFKFSAMFTQISKHVELFSFSIPEDLEKDLRPGIEQWGNVMNSWVNKSNGFSETKFFCDPVFCLSVAL